ncbi:hypothetical protein EKK97_14535 [Billgrantia tianxiuensis]|uniref:Biotin carboxylation domain-containing protein n=1 Tax=Billgrantia tianxiuensis TaxID=2497861 RepID=A0A6I6SS72_9GAMM|nr:biotin carboxylase N-terminal domain-containing protein [Halomonas tianxiuensis]QHC50570.1 hypothetical protein EKK97_14535 [Halomonas tianxiuensis]
MKTSFHAITADGQGHVGGADGESRSLHGAYDDVLRQGRWRGVMLAGSGLAALRAGQACTELELAWHDSGGAMGEALVERARRWGCDALHPGEATAEEQWHLARCCSRSGLAFIGPRESLIAAMCDDDAARQLMREAGLPLGEMSEQALRVHLPVLADSRGQALALVEHQLLGATFAMAPSERLTPEQRAYLGQLAVQGARSLGLVGLATLSFSLAENRLGFVSMRPGLTGYEGLAEVLSGLDLAVEQIRLVAGERLRRPGWGTWDTVRAGLGRRVGACSCQEAGNWVEGPVSGSTAPLRKRARPRCACWYGGETARRPAAASVEPWRSGMGAQLA